MTPSDQPSPAPALAGDIGELRFTLEITRAATGKTETVEMIGRITGFGEPTPEEKETEQ